MKKINLLFIMIFSLSLAQVVSAQSEKSTALNNGRPAGMEAKSPVDNDGKIEYKSDSNQSGSDQDVPGSQSFFDGSEWVMPHDLDMLLDMFEDRNGKGSRDIDATDAVNIKDHLRQLQLENAQMRMDMNNMLKQMASCCEALSLSGDEKSVNDSFILQNSPNPAMSETMVNFYIPVEYDFASLKITDLTGKVIKTVSLTDVGSGNVNVRTEDLSAGTYIYSLVVDDTLIESRLMNVTK